VREACLTPVTKSAGLSKFQVISQRRKRTTSKEEFSLLLSLIFLRMPTSKTGERFFFKFKTSRQMSAIPIFMEWTLPEIN